MNKMTTWLLCSYCATGSSYLSLIYFFPLLASRLLLLLHKNLWEKAQQKEAATPVAAEQVYHCLGALSRLVGPF